MIYAIFDGSKTVTTQLQGCPSPSEAHTSVLLTFTPKAGSAFTYIDGVLNELPRPENAEYFDELSGEWVCSDLVYKHAVHRKREELLLRSDWTQLPDVPLATKQVWATYRQGLRDITTQPGYPACVVWPVKPQ